MKIRVATLRLRDLEDAVAAMLREVDVHLGALARDNVRRVWPWMLTDPVSDVAWSPEPITAYRLTLGSPERLPSSEVWLTAHCLAPRYLTSGLFREEHLGEALRRRIGHQGSAPDPGCSCGFYAYRALDAVLRRVPRSHSSDVWVWRVELAGRVIEHERGYRAERMRFLAPETMRPGTLSGVEMLFRNPTTPASGGGGAGG